MSTPFKRPESVLVVIHTPEREVLLLERLIPAGFWQSVTGSLEDGETPLDTALREVAEETGLIVHPDALHDWHQTHTFEINPLWRHRYAPGVTQNLEHLFSLCLPEKKPVQLAPDEHTTQLWLPQAAAADKVFSWTNRNAILNL